MLGNLGTRFLKINGKGYYMSFSKTPKRHLSGNKQKSKSSIHTRKVRISLDILNKTLSDHKDDDTTNKGSNSHAVAHCSEVSIHVCEQHINIDYQVSAHPRSVNTAVDQADCKYKFKGLTRVLKTVAVSAFVKACCEGFNMFFL